MKVRFLSVQEILTLHTRAIERYGGSHGIRDARLLDSAAHVAQASYGGQFLYPSLFDQAAAMLIAITMNHPFVDGNKRTAIAAALVFLQYNGIRLKLRWKDGASTVEDIASGEMRDWREISEWLEDAYERQTKRSR